ncbi:hypothetical protein [Brevundimonas sp.]|uniref:hypothetical protein n=1 Tax=Brevundimonas sp. TaxID=1871086 RepID=UPI0028AD84C1|nr:hypothetical protein [Brevundimonas sp.]
MASATFTPGEAVLIPARVIRPAGAGLGEWGCMSIEDGWSSYSIDFVGDAVIHGLARGVILAPSHAGAGKWDVQVENGLAGVTVTVPGDMLASALEPLRRAA